MVTDATLGSTHAGVGLGQSPRTVAEKITTALADLNRSGLCPGLIKENPGVFLWELYKVWVDNGGQDGGKNRNSIRRMRDVWLTGDMAVKSLHPKLTGRVRINRTDARSLIVLFLSRWTFVGASSSNDGYEPFPGRRPEDLAELIVDTMFAAGSPQAKFGLLLPARPGMTPLAQLQSDWSDIMALYRESDATIILSRNKTTIGADQAETMRNFWQLLEDCRSGMDNPNAVFVWIVDIGSRRVECRDAWREFLNFEMLKAQFRAVATFDSIDDDPEAEGDDRPVEKDSQQNNFLRSLTVPEGTCRKRRWAWLCERSVVVVQNLRSDEVDGLYAQQDEMVATFRLKDIGVTAENILPSILPYSWGSKAQLRELYGNKFNKIADATLTVFYKREGWGEPGIGGPLGADMRYFAHALVPEDKRAGGELSFETTMSRELESPGNLYDEAFRIVYWAARHRLNAASAGANHERDWAIAVAYLRKLGFQVIKLPDLLNISE